MIDIHGIEGLLRHLSRRDRAGSEDKEVDGSMSGVVTAEDSQCTLTLMDDERRRQRDK